MRFTRYLLCAVLVGACEVPLVVQFGPAEGGSRSGSGGEPDLAGAGGDPASSVPAEGGATGNGGSRDEPNAGASGEPQAGAGGGESDVLPPCALGHELGALVVSAGESHACAIEAATGYLYCWGAGQSGQLGNGQTQDSNVPVLVAVERQYRDVKVGAVFTCAISVEDDLYCFGDNFDGQLANGQTQGSPVPVLTLSGVEQLAVSAGYVLATTGVELLAWGSNDHGQLGLGDSAVGQVLRQATDVGVGARLLTAGYRHACFSAPGTSHPYCAGTNQGSRLGLPGGDSSTFTRVEQAEMVSLSAGFDRTCGVSSAGLLECWGNNVPTTFAGRPPELAMPMQVGVSEAWRRISVGFDHVCGTRMGDEIVCSGDNSQGELGSGLGSSAEFVAPKPRFRSVSVSAGRDFTCAIREPDKAVVCFGSNQNGKLGRGSDDPGPGAPALVCLP